MVSSNTRGVVVLTVFMLGALAGVAVYGTVLYGETVGSLPAEERETTAVRFEKLENAPAGGAALTESDIADTSFAGEVDRAIDQNTTAFSDLGESVPRDVFSDGQTYRHGDSYYKVTFETVTYERYPPFGYLDFASVFLSLMGLSTVFALFSLFVTPFYIIDVLVFARNWDQNEKHLVWYILVLANVLITGTAGLLIL